MAAAAERLRDTSVATSAFTGALMVALTSQPPLPLGPALQLSCDVATRSWQNDGRSGLPTASEVPSELLYYAGS